VGELWGAPVKIEWGLPRAVQCDVGVATSFPSLLERNFQDSMPLNLSSPPTTCMLCRSYRAADSALSSQVSGMVVASTDLAPDHSLPRTPPCNVQVSPLYFVLAPYRILWNPINTRVVLLVGYKTILLLSRWPPLLLPRRLH
jgi:hypothetical protein